MWHCSYLSVFPLENEPIFVHVSFSEPYIFYARRPAYCDGQDIFWFDVSCQDFDFLPAWTPGQGARVFRFEWE